MRLRAAVASDRGHIRPANEDSFLLRPGLYAVCDGMGGARAGEVASQMACMGLLALNPASAGRQDLRRAIVSTNKAIIDRSVAEEHLLGMGTTITVALIKAGTLTLAHVGDSRAYLLHAGSLTQMTDDHSWVGEMVRRGELTPSQAATHPHRSVITRVLGTEGDADPDISEVSITAGDRVLLCSDGLTGMVPDEVISELLQQGADPQFTAESLVKAALAGGGEDNVTVVVIDIEAEDAPAGADGEGKASVDDRILIGPGDRGASVAAWSHRSRRAGAAVRERLGRRVAPLARPVASPTADESTAEPAGGSPKVADADKAGGAAAAEAATARQEDASLGATESAPAETQAPAEAPAPAGVQARPRARRRWVYWAVVVVLVLALAVGGLAWFNSTIYYVGANDGKVALFHGLPATVLGIELSSVFEQGTVDYGSLTPYMRERVDSHDYVSKEEGQLFLRTLNGEQ